MKVFRDTKRRATQQMLQSLGVVKGAEDSEFQEETEEYRKTVAAVKSLQKSMRNHLEALQKQQEAAAALTVELAAFYQGTPFADAAMEIGQAHERLERVQMASIERLYQEQIISAADELLWEVPEVEEQLKQRKGLFLDYNAHLRKFETSKAALANSQNEPSNHSGKGGLFGRRKSENEIAEDVQNRKLKLDQAEMAVNNVTDVLHEKFMDLACKRENGEILQSSISALLACELHLTEEMVSRLQNIKSLFPEVEKYDELLRSYDTEFIQEQPLDLEGVAHITNQTRQTRTKQTGLCFGVSLKTSKNPPAIVHDCIHFLERNGGLETEGLFRIPGAQDVVNNLRARYDAGEQNCLASMGGIIDCHDVATLLKLYFRELPEPLVSSDQYNALLNAVRSAAPLNDGKKKQQQSDASKRVCDVVLDLPAQHQQCLGLLLNFLNNVTKNSDQNKMTASNLATCFAPSILRAPEDTAPHVVLHDMQVAIMAVKILIENSDRFPNPIAAKNSVISHGFASERIPIEKSSLDDSDLNLTNASEGLGF